MKAYVSDALWERIQPLLPPPPKRRFRFPGRKPLDFRKVLTGILFVLKTGIAWDDLPADLGCGCGKTCRHYLQRWHEAGVWNKLHTMLLAELNSADEIDWGRALIDVRPTARPVAGSGPRFPEQEREENPRQPDGHQDPADGVDVHRPVRRHVHGEPGVARDARSLTVPSSKLRGGSGH